MTFGGGGPRRTRGLGWPAQVSPERRLALRTAASVLGYVAVHLALLLVVVLLFFNPLLQSSTNLPPARWFTPLTIVNDVISGFAGAGICEPFVLVFVCGVFANCILMVCVFL